MMKSNPAATGRLVRLIRERKGMSQTDLCTAADVGRTTIQEIEAGNRDAQPSTLKRIAKTLGIEYRILRYPSARINDLTWEIEALEEWQERELFQRIGLPDEVGDNGNP